MVEPRDRARKSIHATLEGSSRAGGAGRDGGDLGRYVFRLSSHESMGKSRKGLMPCGTNSPGCECFGYCQFSRKVLLGLPRVVSPRGDHITGLPLHSGEVGRIDSHQMKSI